MDKELEAFVMLLALIGVLAALPLLPAWATYRITPDQELFLQGPFKGLKLRAAGAFVAYLVVLLVLGQYAPTALSIIRSKERPAWTLEAPVIVYGRDGQPIAVPPNFNALSVTFTPDLQELNGDEVTLRLPGNPEDWPRMTFSIPSFGSSRRITAKEAANLKLDIANNHADLGEPIVIRQDPPPDQAITLGQPVK
jgi:hypothetical protein